MQNNIIELIRTDISDINIVNINKEHHLNKWGMHYLKESGGRKNYGLVFVLKGSAAYYMKNEKIITQTNDMLYIKKGSIYDSIVENNEYDMIVINFRCSEDNPFERLNLDFRINIGSNAGLADLFNELYDVWHSNCIF